jgi:hypothetical protein
MMQNARISVVVSSVAFGVVCAQVIHRREFLWLIEQANNPTTGSFWQTLCEDISKLSTC